MHPQHQQKDLSHTHGTHLPPPVNPHHHPSSLPPMGPPPSVGGAHPHVPPGHFLPHPHHNHLHPHHPHLALEPPKPRFLFKMPRVVPNQKEKCLLDVLFVSLRSMDLRTAGRLSAFATEETLTDDDIHVGSFIVHLQPKQVLKEKCELKLQIERNLDKAFNHRVPDTSVKGGLSRVHATIDEQQYMMIRGLLEYNFGECLDDLQFQVPTNEYIDPSLNTILSGHVWTGMFMDIELLNVILDIMTNYPKKDTSLARVDLIKSRLIYESFSDSSRDVDLVSQEILLDDLRFQDYPMNKRTNVFKRILQPMTCLLYTSDAADE